MKRWLPWIICGVLGICCAHLYLEGQRLRAIQQAPVETAASDYASSATNGEESLRAANAEKAELEGLRRERDDLLRLRNEVRELRDGKKGLEAKLNAQERQLTAAKASRERVWTVKEPAGLQPEPIFLKPGMIGAMFEASNNLPVVRAVAENSPAGRAGIKPGEVIISVDGTNVSAMTFAQVMQAVRGDEGTQVTLEIDDGSPSGTRQVILTREKVNPQDIRVPSQPNGPG